MSVGAVRPTATEQNAASAPMASQNSEAGKRCRAVKYLPCWHRVPLDTDARHLAVKDRGVRLDGRVQTVLGVASGGAMDGLGIRLRQFGIPDRFERHSEALSVEHAS